MHKRHTNEDTAATEAAGFESPDSYVSHRIHPGSDPPHQCEYLAGRQDCGARREQVFQRDGFRCVDCGVLLTLESGHLAHGGNTKVSRCWCPENLSSKCWHCHLVVEHGREPRWS